MKDGTKKRGRAENPDTFANFVAGLRSRDKKLVEFTSIYKTLPAAEPLDTWGSLRLFLKREGASDETIIGARLAWRRFRRRFRT